MDYELFLYEWQRVAVDSAPTHHDQLQDLVEFAESQQGRDLTVAEASSSFHIKWNGHNGYVPTTESESDLAKRVKSVRIQGGSW